MAVWNEEREDQLMSMIQIEKAMQMMLCLQFLYLLTKSSFGIINYWHPLVSTVISFQALQMYHFIW